MKTQSLDQGISVVTAELKKLGISAPLTMVKKGLYKVDVTNKFPPFIAKFQNMSYGKHVGKFYISVKIDDDWVGHLTLYTGDVYDKLTPIARHEIKQ